MNIIKTATLSFLLLTSIIIVIDVERLPLLVIRFFAVTTMLAIAALLIEYSVNNRLKLKQKQQQEKIVIDMLQRIMNNLNNSYAKENTN